MTAKDVVEVLGLLQTEGIRVWVDGGWGVDALLAVETRTHVDLDLVVARSDCAAAERALSGLGFAHASGARPGLPARLVLEDQRGRRVDLHPVVFDDHGNAWQELGEGAWGFYPREGLTGRGSIGGRPVACVTAELQLRHRLGYPWSERDLHDLVLLAERFGLPLPPGFRADAVG